MDLEVLQQSHYVIADGTFTFCSSDCNFKQLYVICAFFNSEAVPVVYALMTKRDTEAYTRVFTALRNKIMNQCGSLGNLEQALLITDWEPAAFNGFTTAFPQVTSRTCAFHLAKDLLAKADKLGLKVVYNKVAPYDQQQYSEVYSWIRRLEAVILLPPDAIMHAWQHFLRFCPVTGDQVIDVQLFNFATYFHDTWLSPQWKLNKISHFYSPDFSPRTSNHCEGHNNGLRQKFDREKPPLGEFLVRFQEFHNVRQARIKALRGGAMPRQRAEKYVQNDTRIAESKYHFRGWQNAFHTGQLPLQDYNSVIFDHLNHVQHLLG